MDVVKFLLIFLGGIKDLGIRLGTFSWSSLLDCCEVC